MKKAEAIKHISPGARAASASIASIGPRLRIALAARRHRWRWRSLSHLSTARPSLERVAAGRSVAGPRRPGTAGRVVGGRARGGRRGHGELRRDELGVA